MVNGLVPTRIGYTAGDLPTAFSSSNTEITETTGLGYTPRGLSYFDTSGDQQLIFTIANKIYRYPGNADISRGVAYTNGAFSFAQYREYIYACNGADLLQKSSTGAFADVASTPKLTRICAWGERLFGINNVASFTSGGTPYAASNYRYWISGIGNPEQFDAAIDSTAYTDDIKDDGGPLVACAVLRDFVVVLKRSGVYVIEDTGGPIFAERKVSDYYGCEWPDSVIVVNNIMYWISPTRNGEVVAFDGSQISVVSGALASTIIDQSTSNDAAGWASYSSDYTKGGITAATDGETIVWNRFTTDTNNSILSYIKTEQLYMNIPTGRFGYSNVLNRDNLNGGLVSYLPFGVYSSAAQNAILTVASTQITAGTFTFRPAMMSSGKVAGYGIAEWYRGGPQVTSINNVTLRFSEYTYKNELLPSNSINGVLTSSFPDSSAAPLPAFITGAANPSLKWSSTQTSGDAITKTESTAITAPTGTWNSATKSFNISPATARSASASVFAFSVSGLAPYNSLTSVIVDATQAGTKQAGAKVVQWQ